MINFILTVIIFLFILEVLIAVGVGWAVVYRWNHPQFEEQDEMEMYLGISADSEAKEKRKSV
jgi:hypothetical protein